MGGSKRHINGPRHSAGQAMFGYQLAFSLAFLGMKFPERFEPSQLEKITRGLSRNCTSSNPFVRSLPWLTSAAVL